MKVNFLETIKQKTDEELEIISKDYTFYSKEERLIALNELEYRNNLSEELVIKKKHIENSVETPIITKEASEAIKSAKRIYINRAIWIATSIGGPLVAGYLISENFKVFNETRKAKITWIIVIIGTILLLGGINLIPDNIIDSIPKAFIPLIYTAIAYVSVQHFQEKNIAAFIALGGKSFSWGRTIMVSLIGLEVTIASFYLLIFCFLKIGNI